MPKSLRRTSVLSRMQRSFALVAVLLVAALLAAGCGGSDDEPEGTSATVWRGSALYGGLGLGGGCQEHGERAHEREHLEESLESGADDVKTATNTLVDDVKDLPEPNTESGSRAKEEVDQLADELDKDAETIENAVDDLSDGGGVVAAATTVGTTLATMQSQIKSTVNEVRQLDAQGELKTAFPGRRSLPGADRPHLIRGPAGRRR